MKLRQPWSLKKALVEGFMEIKLQGKRKRVKAVPGVWNRNVECRMWNVGRRRESMLSEKAIRAVSRRGAEFAGKVRIINIINSDLTRF